MQGPVAHGDLSPVGAEARVSQWVFELQDASGNIVKSDQGPG